MAAPVAAPAAAAASEEGSEEGRPASKVQVVRLSRHSAPPGGEVWCLIEPRPTEEQSRGWAVWATRDRAAEARAREPLPQPLQTTQLAPNVLECTVPADATVGTVLHLRVLTRPEEAVHEGHRVRTSGLVAGRGGSLPAACAMSVCIT